MVLVTKKAFFYSEQRGVEVASAKNIIYEENEDILHRVVLVANKPKNQKDSPDETSWIQKYKENVFGHSGAIEWNNDIS